MDPVEAAQQAANRGRRVPEAAATTTTSVEEIVPALIQTPFSATHTNTHTAMDCGARSSVDRQLDRTLHFGCGDAVIHAGDCHSNHFTYATVMKTWGH